ncbi:MAG: FtsX-like permease family protein, partial [Chitinophagaceae bacterium]
KSTLTVSPGFFDIFGFEAVEGNAALALKDPSAIVLTERTARALFGNTRVVGQELRVNNNRTAIVRAVLRDLPARSTISFDALVPFNPSDPQVQRDEHEWVNCGTRTFFRLNPQVAPAAVERQVLALIRKNAPSQNPTTRGSVVLHPMSKWRLWNDFRDGRNVGGRIEYVRLFTWVAVIILLIACVNFMNLSTARSEKRAKEVGIRKTLGSERRQLLGQFLAESLLLSFIAFLFAAAIVYSVLPSFGRLLGSELVFPYDKPLTWIIAAGVVAFTGFVAGSYPAFYLSGFNPIKVLKGTYLPGKSVLMPRKLLVVSQFIASIILISATLIIYQQLRFVQHRNLGYSQEQLLMVRSSEGADKHFSAVRNDLLQSGKVEAVSRTSTPVTNIFGFTSGIRWAGAPDNQEFVCGFIFADAGFAHTFKVKLLEGRDLAMNDSGRVLMNQEAVRQMGLKNPVGQEITWGGNKQTIVGVVEDMVMESPFGHPGPLMVSYTHDWSGRHNLRLSATGDIKSALATVEAIYKKHSPAFPFEYQFVDDDFAQKFANERLVGRLSVTFAGLAIFICCLGLFGLVAFSIERRKKEIGIRKVLGATVQSLLLLLSKEFLMLIGIAFLVAIPAAWWAMSTWLQHYPYRIEVGAGVFALVGLLILVIALLTVSLNASRAALSSPVKSLRHE